VVDFSVFGDYQNPVEFNFSTAEGFSSQLRWTSQRINIFDARTSLVESIASRGFRGFFATVFTQNIHICSADAMALSEALTTAADMVDYLAEQARLENKRRQQVRDFAAQHDDFGDHVRDFFTGVDVPPNLTPAEPPSPPAAPSACDRRSSAGSVDPRLIGWNICGGPQGSHQCRAGVGGSRSTGTLGISPGGLVRRLHLPVQVRHRGGRGSVRAAGSVAGPQ